MNRILQYVADKAKGRPEGMRSSKWDDVQKDFVALNPICRWCGCKDRKKLQVHHKKPFHLFPGLELDFGNLITLCEKCHFVIGHLCFWKRFNPFVEEDCERHEEEMKKAA